MDPMICSPRTLHSAGARRRSTWRLAAAWLLLAAGCAATEVGSVERGAEGEPASAPGPTRRLEAAPARGEFRPALVDVTAALSRAPVVGQEAALTVVLTTKRGGEIPVEIDLGMGFDLIDPPPGFRRTVAPARSEAEAVVWRGSVAVTETSPRRLELTVRAVRAGAAAIEVRATSAAERLVARGRVTATLGDRGSRLGIEIRGEALTFPLVRGEPNADDCLGAAPAVRGSAMYKWTEDGALVDVPIAGAKVELFKAADDSSMGETLTAEDGGFSFCNVDYDAAKDAEKVYVVVSADAASYRVILPDEQVLSMSTKCDCVNGGTKLVFDSFLDLEPLYAEPAAAAGWRAFGIAKMTHEGVAKDGCWDIEGEHCDEVTIVWGPDASLWPHYNGGADRVYLAAATPEEPLVVVHEIGHAIEHRLYDMTSAGCDVPEHFVDQPFPVSSGDQAAADRCALSEGFADALHFFFLDDVTEFLNVNLETPTWWTPGWPDGMGTEGRVAGAILDLLDPATEPYWDNLQMKNNAPDIVFAPMAKSKPKDGAELALAIESFVKDGAVGTEGEEIEIAIRGVFFQNTIDADFCDRLETKKLVRGAPKVTHKYAFDAVPAWNLIEVASSGKKTVGLYETRDLDYQVGFDTDTTAANKATFIAFQSPAPNPVTYYPAVGPTASNNGEYAIFGDHDTLSPGSIAASTVPGRSFRVFTLDGLQPDVLTSILVEPLNGQILDVYLLDATADYATPATFPNLIASKSVLPDTRPILRFTPSATSGTARYGLLVHTRQGSGSFVVNMDQFKPKILAQATDSPGNPWPVMSPYPALPAAFTKVGYLRHRWSVLGPQPDLSARAWESPTTQTIFREESTGPMSSRLVPTTFTKSTWTEAAGAAMFLCMEMLTTGGHTASSCSDLTLPDDYVQYTLEERLVQ